jgi:hypothetical protein
MHTFRFTGGGRVVQEMPRARTPGRKNLRIGQLKSYPSTLSRVIKSEDFQCNMTLLSVMNLNLWSPRHSSCLSGPCTWEFPLHSSPHGFPPPPEHTISYGLSEHRLEKGNGEHVDYGTVVRQASQNRSVRSAREENLTRGEIVKRYRLG